MLPDPEQAREDAKQVRELLIGFPRKERLSLNRERLARLAGCADEYARLVEGLEKLRDQLILDRFIGSADPGSHRDGVRTGHGDAGDWIDYILGNREKPRPLWERKLTALLGEAEIECPGPVCRRRRGETGEPDAT